MAPIPPRTEARALALPDRAPALRLPLALLEAMRPKQWIKNVFVFAGLVFGGQLFDGASQLRTLACFALFCAASSSVYLINDTFDKANDAHHPTKCLRPIASGRLPVPVAVTAAFLLAFGSLGAAFTLSWQTFLILAVYLAFSAGYTSGLKRVFILDVLIVSSGFVLRAAAGAAAVNAEISPWLICCTFLLALYLALGKRRHELLLLGDTATNHRKSLGAYSVALLDSWLTALAGATIVSYTIYTQSARTVEHFGTTNLVYTVPFVVYALFRYQWLMMQKQGGGDPGQSLTKDRGMMVAIGAWAAVAALIIYTR